MYAVKHNLQRSFPPFSRILCQRSDVVNQRGVCSTQRGRSNSPSYNFDKTINVQILQINELSEWVAYATLDNREPWWYIQNAVKDVRVILSVYLDLLRNFQKIILIHWKKCSYYTQTTEILLAAAKIPHWLLPTVPTDKASGGIKEGDTPPLLVRSIQGGLGRYEVRKGSVRSTQKFCYNVYRTQT